MLTSIRTKAIIALIASAFVGVAIRAQVVRSPSATRPATTMPGGARPATRPTTSPLNRYAGLTVEQIRVDPAIVKSHIAVAYALVDLAEHDKPPRIVNGHDEQGFAVPPEGIFGNVRLRIDALAKAAAADIPGAIAAVASITMHPSYADQMLLKLAQFRALSGDPAGAFALIDAARVERTGPQTQADTRPAARLDTRMPEFRFEQRMPTTVPAEIRLQRRIAILRTISVGGDPKAVRLFAAAVTAADSSPAVATTVAGILANAHPGTPVVPTTRPVAATRPATAPARPRPPRAATTRPVTMPLAGASVLQFVAVAEQLLSDGDKAEAARVASGLAARARLDLGNPNAYELSEAIRILGAAGDIEGAKRALVGINEPMSKGAVAPALARVLADVGDDRGALALVDPVMGNGGKLKIFQAVASARLARGDRVGAVEAFRQAIAAAATDDQDPSAAARLAVETANAQREAGDRAGAAATYAAAARAIGSVSRNDHMVPMALQMLAQAQLDTGDAGGMLSWAGTVGKPLQRRRMLLKLATDLVSQTAEGRAHVLLRLDAPPVPGR